MSDTQPATGGQASQPSSFRHPLFRVLADEFRVSHDTLNEINEELAGRMPALADLKALLLHHEVSTPEVLQQGVARMFGLEFIPSLDDAEISPEFTASIPIRYAKKFMFFPTRMTDEELWVAVENPDVLDPIEDVGRRFKRRIRQVVSTHQAILSLINRAYDRADATTDQVFEVIDAASSVDAGSPWGIEEPEDLIDAHDEEPIKKLLNNILYQAAKSNTSDVHIDANSSEVVVRFRVDGVLHNTLTLPKGIQRTLINRIKIMSRLDISQRGLPQDGRTLILIGGRKIDIRVSTMPTVFEEKAVMRLLYQDQDLFGLEQLGMPEQIYTKLSQLVKQTGGIILVSGPTGSGKTTTLYGALNEIDRHSLNIMTIEDPVEYKMAGYVQIEVNPKVGLTFANALRSVLRQDPDVIMVGEMRDQETAMIAIQAALTGHTVFSTVHTNSAPATIARLVDMGVEPYLISSSLMAVLAQRLVRRICDNCREEIPVNLALLMELGIEKTEQSGWKSIYHGKGCANCNGTGYQGRVGLFELLVMTEPVKSILLKTSDANQIRDVAVSDGMLSMRQAGQKLVRDGVTTIEEILHATRED
ncbi:MAG: ATPase, T2SS/T4P/T4SS family [SAR324 cluster bacterium]|nr:ATPase, T2SS/T4P/T4SS family [SAR324 cluster bacterium]